MVANYIIAIYYAFIHYKQKSYRYKKDVNMQKNFIHFLSKVPTNIYINGTYLGLINNQDCMELDIITNTEKIYVQNQPISNDKNYIPYTYILDTNNNVKSTNKNIQIIPFPNNQWDIIMEPLIFNQMQESKILLNKNISNYYISAINNIETTIYVYSGQNILINKVIPLLTNIKVEILKSLMVIEGIIDNNTYYLLVLDLDTLNTLISGTYQSIQINENGIQVLQKTNNLPQYLKIIKFDLLSKNIEYYYTYSNDNVINTKCKYYLPKLLLQSIIAQDNTTIHQLLSDKYANTNAKQLQSYFGQIDEIYLNRHSIKNEIINYTILSDNIYKNYDFVCHDGIILDIIENINN